MFPARNEVLDLHNDLDKLTSGALYALQYRSATNGWEPHVWAQRLGEGRSRFIFFAVDQSGNTKYFDYATSKDPAKIDERVRFIERLVEGRKAGANIQANIRGDVPYTEEDLKKLD